MPQAAVPGARYQQQPGPPAPSRQPSGAPAPGPETPAAGPIGWLRVRSTRRRLTRLPALAARDSEPFGLGGLHWLPQLSGALEPALADRQLGRQRRVLLARDLQRLLETAPGRAVHHALGEHPRVQRERD